ncbi:hypothetical protein AL036_16400 [Salipiger aestuarii]|nr:hypothetical protein AL036_16400 [Salipiger aestuarii]
MAANMGGVNMSEVLAKLVEFAQSEGLIAHEIPGVKINKLSNGLVIKFDEEKSTSFDFDQAESLVNEIRAFLAGDRTSGTLTADATLKGKGQGIAIAIPATAPAKVFDRGLAAEFARLIEMHLPEAA